ncbi:dicarboxylate transporter/tellurite-resistance protein TehA [Otariodibacter oris]|uniref:Tellurite resistance protein n=2 Tax=Otariodibacter oris TaxID=1032623 RepID=A0A420XF52_9PAST|nr:dicarboxylate transporter/tellurite-resistance protein TehA [Otariodibacter oris]RKR71150.1 tellurite resistance protein [Otariodibacter oris]
MTTKSKVFPIPTSYFGIVLGLSALGLAWRYATPFLQTTLSLYHLPNVIPSIISESLLIVAGFAWIVFISAYIWKWIAYRAMAKEELTHPLLGSFVSLIPITTIFVGLIVLPYIEIMGQILIFVGIIIQLLFASYYMAGMWRGTYNIESTTPVLYLPTVASNFVSATALSTLGYTEWAYLFWGAGTLSWLSLEPVILNRLRTIETVPEPIRPVISIALAPTFVACATYLTINGGVIDLIAKAIIGYGILQFFFFLRIIHWIMVRGFTISLWGFSFALASMAKVGMYLYIATQGQNIGILGLPMFIIANLCIGGLIIGTLLLVFKGKFLAK